MWIMRAGMEIADCKTFSSKPSPVARNAEIPRTESARLIERPWNLFSGRRMSTARIYKLNNRIPKRCARVNKIEQNIKHTSPGLKKIDLPATLAKVNGGERTHK